jgi:Pyruvate/2-oxoacid:ferredoxin oxidoreductase delta subunit
MYCPEGAVDDDLNVDLTFCKGCGICANECPKKAIEIVRAERESISHPQPFFILRVNIPL